MNGSQKNPATIPMPRTEIPSQYVAEFRNQSAAELAQLDQARTAPDSRVASR